MCAVWSLKPRLELSCSFYKAETSDKKLRDLMVSKGMFLNHNEGLDSASLKFLNVTGDEEETLDFNSLKLELY